MKLFHLSKKARDRKRKNVFASLLTIFLIILFAVPTGLYFADGYIDKHFKAELPEADELIDNVNNIEYEGKSPDNLSAIDTYLVASKILNEKEYYKVTTDGIVDAQVTTQEISGIFIKDGLNYSNETYSKGMVSVASKAIYTPGSDVIIYEGKKSSNSTSYAWNNANTVTYDYYRENYGKDASYCWSYIISSKTVIAQTKCTKEDDLYTYTISLDPTTSTIYYKNQIRLLSGLKSDPEFKSIQITFTVNENFEFKSLVIKETYTMNYVGVKVTVSCVENPLSAEFSYEK